MSQRSTNELDREWRGRRADAPKSVVDLRRSTQNVRVARAAAAAVCLVLPRCLTAWTPRHVERRIRGTPFRLTPSDAIAAGKPKTGNCVLLLPVPEGLPPPGA